MISVCFAPGLGGRLAVGATGGIVSNFEHLEGGKHLWKSFVRLATVRGLKFSLVDTGTGQWMPVDANTTDEFILYLDDSKKRMALEVLPIVETVLGII